MKQEIVCAGFGGQGIMLLGRIIAQTAMDAGKNVTWMPSYGAEVRGGTAHCMVIVSDGLIASPVVTRPDAAIVMNRPSLLKFAEKLKPGGILLVNSSLADEKVERKDMTVVKIPATETAHQLGSIKVANVVMLGAYLARTKIFGLDEAARSLAALIPAQRRELLEINQAALKKGNELANSK